MWPQKGVQEVSTYSTPHATRIAKLPWCCLNPEPYVPGACGGSLKQASGRAEHRLGPYIPTPPVWPNCHGVAQPDALTSVICVIRLVWRLCQGQHRGHSLISPWHSSMLGTSAVRNACGPGRA